MKIYIAFIIIINNKFDIIWRIINKTHEVVLLSYQFIINVFQINTTRAEEPSNLMLIQLIEKSIFIFIEYVDEKNKRHNSIIDRKSKYIIQNINNKKTRNILAKKQNVSQTQN